MGVPLTLASSARSLPQLRGKRNSKYRRKLLFKCTVLTATEQRPRSSRPCMHLPTSTRARACTTRSTRMQCNQRNGEASECRARAAAHAPKGCSENWLVLMGLPLVLRLHRTQAQQAPAPALSRPRLQQPHRRVATVVEQRGALGGDLLLGAPRLRLGAPRLRRGRRGAGDRAERRGEGEGRMIF